MELQRSRPQYGDSQSRLSLRERNGCESAASQDRLNVPEVLEDWTPQTPKVTKIPSSVLFAERTTTMATPLFREALDRVAPLHEAGRGNQESES